MAIKTPEQIAQETAPASLNPNPSPLSTPAPIVPPDAPVWQAWAIWNWKNWEKPTVDSGFNKPMEQLSPINLKPQVDTGFNKPVNNFDIIPWSPQDLANKAWPITTPWYNPEIKLNSLDTTPQPTQKDVTTVSQTPTATTTTKETPTTPIDPNIRINEINKNLNEWLKNDPTVQNAINTWNIDQFKAKYNMQDPNEAKIVQDYFNAHTPNNPDSIYNLMTSGQNKFGDSIKSTPAFLTAKKRFDNLQQFKWFDQWQLSSALAEGYLTPWTQLYNDLSQDPSTKLKLDNAQKLNLINKVPVDANKVSNNVMQDIIDTTPLWQALKDWQITAQEMNAITSTPDITQKQNEVQSKKDQYDTLKAEYDNIDTTTKEELKGKDVSSAYVDSLIWERQKSIFKRLSVMESSYNNALWTLADMKKTQADLFSTNLNLYQDQKKTQQAKTALQEQRTYDEAQAKKALQDKFDYTYWDLKSTNPQIQRVAAEKMAQAIQDQYKWMPFRRDVATMWADIQAAINAGQTTEQITTDITNAIQNAPDYANWKANNKLIGDQTGKFSMWFDPVTGKPYVLNAQTWEIQGSNAWVGWNTVVWNWATWTSLYQAMTASTNPVWVYATWDMDWSRHAAIYNTAQSVWLNNFINQYAGTKVTPDMVNQAAQKFWVDPLMIAATMALDSSMWTKWLWAKNNNPWNVGQFDSLWTKWVAWYNSLQEWVNAVAGNLAKRQTALWLGGTDKKYSPVQTGAMDAFMKSSQTPKDEYNFLTQNGLSKTDVNSYLNPSTSTWPAKPTKYTQYWLLSTTDFNPDNATDSDAKKYLDIYLKSSTWAMPTATALFWTARWANQAKFEAAATRANELYYNATWSALPDLSILKNNKSLINANNKLENSLNIQEWTVNKNFKLAIDNIDKSWINQNSMPINSWINSIKEQMSDPDTMQYLSQNKTLANEVWSLLALKNASWTTVADKLEAAWLVPANASEEAQKSILRVLMQEANNARKTINETQWDLYSQIDPLQLDKNNPNRINTLNNHVQDNWNWTYSYFNNWKVVHTWKWGDNYKNSWVNVQTAFQSVWKPAKITASNGKSYSLPTK